MGGKERLRRETIAARHRIRSVSCELKLLRILTFFSAIDSSPQTDVHAGLPFLEDDGEEDAKKRKGEGTDDFSSDLSEDDDDDDGGGGGGGGEHPAKPRGGVLAAEGDRHSEFSVSADEDDISNLEAKLFPEEMKSGGREAEAKSKSIFDDTDGSSDEGGGLFDRRPPAMMTPFKGEEASANGDEESERDAKYDTSERDDKEIIKPKPMKPVLLGFAAELARKIGAPPPSSRPGGPQTEIEPGATDDPGADVEAQRPKSSPPETKNESLEVVKVHKSRSAGNARENSNRSATGLFGEDSSSEDELFRPARTATRNAGRPSTSRHALFDSDSDSDGGLFTGESDSLYSGKLLISDPGSNTPIATKPRQDRESITKSNLEYHPAPNKIRPNDDPDVRKPQSWLARKSTNKKTLFEDSNDEDDGDMFSPRKTPFLSGKKPVLKRPENSVTPPNEKVQEKYLNDETVTVNSSINETVSRSSQEGFSYPSDLSEGHPHSEKEKVERMNTREESIIVNSGQTESTASMAKPTRDDMSSKMSNQKMTAPRRKASLTDIFGDDSDSGDIFSTLRIQSRKVINSNINRVDRKVPNDEGLSIEKTVGGESPEKPVRKKTVQRSYLFGSSTDDDEDGLFRKTTPQENSIVAEKGSGGLFAGSYDEDNIKTDEGVGLTSKVSSESINVYSDSRDLGRDCADGNTPSREIHPRASASKPSSDKTSGDDDGDEESAAAMATRFGGARPKSSTRRTQNDGDINDDTAAARRPKRLHATHFDAAFKTSLSATLVKGPVSPGSVRRSSTPGATSPKVTTPPKKEEKAVPKAEAFIRNTEAVDEDPGLLTGAVKYRAKMARPKRRLPSRYMRQKSSPQTDVADSPNFVKNDTTCPTLELSKQEERTDIGSSPDPSRLPPPMPPESPPSEDSTSRGTKSSSPVRNKEIDEGTKETKVPTKVVAPPQPEKTELLSCNEEGIENHASMATDERMNITKEINQETQRPAGEVDGKEVNGGMRLHTAEKTPNARTEKGSLFESSSDSEDLFAKKPIAAIGNVGMKSRLSESSSDSDDLFSSAKRKG